MILNSKMNKRLGIFIFYDKDNIIDDYVIYMLDSLTEAVNELIIVSNSKLDKKELSKFEKYTDKIHIRENKGLDAGAFKEMYDLYGKDYFSNFDELVLMNDTFFGPFKPFKEIFKTMEKRNVDFWGLTALFKSVDGFGTIKLGYIPDHIQTYFIAFRNSVLISDAFNDYWKNYQLDKMLSFNDVVTKHETMFTKYLSDNGFKWDTYVNMEHYKSEDLTRNYNVYGYSAYTLIKYFNCPFIKRKNLVFGKNDALYINNGMDTVNALKYIKENNLYDVNMIYKNIIRIYPIYDIYYSLNLNYIVEPTSENKAKNLIIVFVSEEKVYNFVKQHYDTIKNSDIRYVTDNIEFKSKNVEYTENNYNYLIKNREDIIKKYENVCIMNHYYDLDLSLMQEMDDSLIIKNIENAVYSDEYINGVTKLLSDNYTGVLLIPESYHNHYFDNIAGFNWTKNFLDIKVIENKEKIEYGFTKDMELTKEIIASLDAIWLKSDILNSLIECDNISIQMLISYLPYIAKLNNKYIGKIYNKDYLLGDVSALSNAINHIIKDKFKQLSYPNIELYRPSLLRRLFRKVVPKSARRKMLKVYRKVIK